MPDTIRRLTVADVEIWRELRLESLRLAPFAFGARLADYVDAPLETFVEQLKTTNVFAAFVDGQAVGCMRWYREPYPSEAHRGHVVSVYLRAEHRATGLADALLAAILADARQSVIQLHLDVGVKNHVAHRFYLRHGFVDCGTIPRVVCIDGVYLDEIHMVLPLDA